MRHLSCSLASGFGVGCEVEQENDRERAYGARGSDKEVEMEGDKEVEMAKNLNPIFFSVNSLGQGTS